MVPKCGNTRFCDIRYLNLTSSQNLHIFYYFLHIVLKKMRMSLSVTFVVYVTILDSYFVIGSQRYTIFSNVCWFLSLEKKINIHTLIISVLDPKANQKRRIIIMIMGNRWNTFRRVYKDIDKSRSVYPRQAIFNINKWKVAHQISTGISQFRHKTKYSGQLRCYWINKRGQSNNNFGTFW